MTVSPTASTQEDTDPATPPEFRYSAMGCFQTRRPTVSVRCALG